MALTDKQFREEFKPLHVPASYVESATQQDKILFALAQLGEATGEEVLVKLGELDPGINDPQMIEGTEEFLKAAFDKGLLNGGERNGRMHYNLNKVTSANEGAVDPDLLTPGLD